MKTSKNQVIVSNKMEIKNGSDRVREFDITVEILETSFTETQVEKENHKT